MDVRGWGVRRKQRHMNDTLVVFAPTRTTHVTTHTRTNTHEDEIEKITMGFGRIRVVVCRRGAVSLSARRFQVPFDAHWSTS